MCVYTDDEGNDDILTPGHLLKGSPLNCVPEPDTTLIPENRLSRWQLVQAMHRHFWKRWNNEYLSTLQTRSKWTEKRENIKPGMLVLVKEENLPPNKWKLLILMIKGLTISSFPPTMFSSWTDLKRKESKIN